MRTLPEAWMLLAMGPDGRFRAWWSHGAWYGLVGAALIELERRGRVRFEGPRVLVADGTPTGEPALDGALATLAASRPRSASAWVAKLPYAAPDLRLAAGRALVARGEAREEPARFLRAARFPPDARVVAALRESVRAARDPEALALLALADAVGWLSDFASWRERRALRPRLGGGVVPSAVEDAIRAANDGAAVAALAATYAGG